MTRLLTAMAMAALLAACTAGPGPGLAARYCYRALAEVDCQAQPRPGEASRKVGIFDEVALNYAKAGGRRPRQSLAAS